MVNKKKQSGRKPNKFSLMNSYSSVLNNHLQQGESIFYARNCMLPILNVKMLVKERSREELGDVDLMLFRLLDQGIRTLHSISLLTGLAEKLVSKHLNEMIGRSFVEWNNPEYKLTELGAETLASGVPIRKVHRAFRYCAVTERLLPKSAYELVFTKVDDLRGDESTRMFRSSHVMGERQLVSLAGIDLSKIENKRDFNITDEAKSFDRVEGYDSGFLQTKLFLVGRQHPERAIISFGKACLQYNASDIIPFIVKQDKESIRSALCDELTKDGLIAEKIDFDSYGLPIIYLESAPQEWLSKRIESGIQAVMLCGETQDEALPVTSWKLRGFTVRYVISDRSIVLASQQLRHFVASCESFYAVPYKDRSHSSIKLFVAERFDASQIEQLRRLSITYDIRRIQSWLPAGVEEEVA